jgi:hypothetical protein
MHFPVVPLPIPLSIPILSFFVIYSWLHRETRFAFPFAAVMLLGLFWRLTSTLKLASSSLAVKVLWARLHFLSTAIVAVYLFGVINKGHRMSQWNAPWPFVLALLEPSLVIFFALGGWATATYLCTASRPSE